MLPEEDSRRSTGVRPPLRLIQPSQHKFARRAGAELTCAPGDSGSLESPRHREEKLWPELGDARSPASPGPPLDPGRGQSQRQQQQCGQPGAGLSGPHGLGVRSEERQAALAVGRGDPRA